MVYTPKGDNFILPVKLAIQLNNTGGLGYKECFGTCATAHADYLLDGELTKKAKERGFREPEDVYFERLSRYGDTTDWNAQMRCLDSFGITTYSSRTASLNDVAHSLYRGIPVIMGTKYKASGHIVLAIGRSPQGLAIMCPNGIRAGASNDWVTRFYSDADAKVDNFSWSLLKKVFTDLGDEAGWALFTTAVKGVPTGVRANM